MTLVGVNGCAVLVFASSVPTFAISQVFHRMKAIHALAAAALLSLSSAAVAPAARADDDAKINARISSWGVACKNAVAVKYPKSVMADITVELGRTLQQSIDAGTTTLADIKKGGLSYNWSYKKHTGTCNTDGAGNVVELMKFQ